MVQNAPFYTTTPGPSVFPTGHSFTVCRSSFLDRRYVVRKSTDADRVGHFEFIPNWIFYKEAVVVIHTEFTSYIIFFFTDEATRTGIRNPTTCSRCILYLRWWKEYIWRGRGRSIK